MTGPFGFRAGLSMLLAQRSQQTALLLSDKELESHQQTVEEALAVLTFGANDDSTSDVGEFNAIADQVGQDLS